MSRSLVLLLVFVIIFHIVAFTGEVFLWMNPSVHEFILQKLDAPAGVGIHEQALILKTLFVNQGFYNLFVALGGIAGFWLRAKGFKAQGMALLAYMCVFAVGAGLVLFFTTSAYIGSVLQSVPAFIALILLYKSRLFISR
jgi:putative membrane protein